MLITPGLTSIWRTALSSLFDQSENQPLHGKITLFFQLVTRETQGGQNELMDQEEPAQNELVDQEQLVQVEDEDEENEKWNKEWNEQDEGWNKEEVEQLEELEEEELARQ